jgi:putative hemolysin
MCSRKNKGALPAVKEAALVLPMLAAMAAVPRPAPALENPASAFCEQTGGRSEIVQTTSGDQLGLCILPGGQIVEEWAYYRARNPPASQGR